MTKTAWVFPGQGSQAVGMGADLKDIPAANIKFKQAELILGWSVFNKCQGDAKELSRTLYTQPCLYVIETILVDLLREKGQYPDLVAGHSLGEYSALYAAGVFDFESGLRLVKKRAELMDESAGGKMAALIKFDQKQLTTCLQTTTDVVLANDNSDEQVVISGTPAAVDLILSQVKVKRGLKLNVSGAFHSPLMANAAQQFSSVLELVEFKQAKIPVLSNIDPTPETDASILKDRLIQQMTGSVRWREIVLQFADYGISQAVEVGPGKVLTGLIKRTCPEIGLKHIRGLADL